MTSTKIISAIDNLIKTFSDLYTVDKFLNEKGFVDTLFEGSIDTYLQYHARLVCDIIIEYAENESHFDYLEESTDEIFDNFLETIFQFACAGFRNGIYWINGEKKEYKLTSAEDIFNLYTDPQFLYQFIELAEDTSDFNF